MKYLRLILIVGLMLTKTAAAQSDDADLTRRLLGTWTDDPTSKSPLASSVTYNADGTSTTSMHPRDQPESTGLQITARWSINDRVLFMKSVNSSDPQKLPAGLELKDRIISISDDRFVFEAFEGYGASKGKQDTRIRKK